MQRVVLATAAWALSAGGVLGQGATQMQVVNATTERVEVRIDKPVGGSSSWLFVSGRGHFDPAPLAQGLGDRVVSVRAITANGTVVLPSKVLAMSRFDPAAAAGPVLRVIFIRGIAGYDVVYETATTPGAAGTPVMAKVGAEGGGLSADQKKAVEETLKMPATKGGGN